MIDADTPEASPDWKRELGWTALAGAVVVLFAVLLVLRDPGYFYHDDYQIAALPAFYDMARAIREGTWPLLSPYSWIEGNLAGELQAGTFSLWINGVLLLAWALNLTLPHTAAFISIVYLAVLATGVFRLARHSGLPVEFAAVVMLGATLNGFIMGWAANNWLILLSSFAWLPWAWWAMARAIAPGASPWRMLPAGIFLYLLLTAGWPFTILMAVFVTAWLSLRDMVQQRRGSGVVVLFFCWVIGGGLSAPAYLLFLDNLPETLRGTSNSITNAWSVPLQGLWGLLLPTFGSFWSDFGLGGKQRLHLPLELFNGLAPTVALLAALAIARERLVRLAGWELVFAALMVLAIQLPSVLNLRWSFRWLPLTHLLLALVAGWALLAIRQQLATSPSGWKQWLASPGLWAIATVGLAWALQPKVMVAPALPAVLLGLGGLWLGVDRAFATGHPLRRWMPATVTLAALWACLLQIPNALSVPTWNIPEAIRQPAPLDPRLRYLGVSLHNDFRMSDVTYQPFGTILRPGNTPMYAGLEFINGYSPVAPRGLVHLLYQDPHGYLMPVAIRYVLMVETHPNGLLRLWGVDGLVLGASLSSFIPELEQRGWEVTYTHAEGTVLRRLGPPSASVWSLPGVNYVRTFPEVITGLQKRKNAAVPFLMVDPDAAEPARPFAHAEATLVSTRRGHHVIEVKNPSATEPAMIAVSKPWFPGYRAWLGGKELAVRQLNASIPAIEVPPGAQGRLELVFWPRKLEIGLAITALTLGLTPLVLGLLARRRRRV